jgi:hypothetical protein
LLIAEDGGRVSNLEGNDSHLKRGHPCAGNLKKFAQMFKDIGPHLTDGLKSDHA